MQAGGRPIADPYVAPSANEPVATPDPPGQPPSPEAAPVAEAGEPITNEDVDPSATAQAGVEPVAEPATGPADTGSAEDPKTEEGTK